jgi:uncharacterized protein (TIGR03437 family)
MKNSAATLLFALAGFAAAQTYTYSTFDPPGSTSTVVTGMNNAGQIVGSYTDAKGTHNFLRSADGSTYTTIDLAGVTPGSTTIGAINNTGQIAGTYTDAAARLTRCYVGSVDGSTFTPFDLPDFGPFGGPHGLNDSGVVSGAIVEVSASSAGGFVRTPDGTITPIAPQAGTRVRGIDNNGDIVGYYVAEGSEDVDLIKGFVRNPAGAFTTFDLPGTDNGTQLAAINNHGQVFGTWFFSGSVFAGIADGSYPFLSIPGAQASTPAAINDSGSLAGYYFDGTTSHGFLAIPSAGSTQPFIRTAVPGVITALAFGGAWSIAPGTWIEIYGENLSTTSRAWQASDFTGDTAPTSLSGVTVSVGGIPAFVSYISPGQVNAFVPSNVPAGSVQVTVSNGTQTSAPYKVTVNAVQPSLWVLPHTDDAISQYLGAVFPDFTTYVLPPGYTTAVPTRAAHPGDSIVLLGLGLGPVNPNVPAGQIASQASMLQTLPTVSFNGTPATVTYAGLMAGTVGLYQINVVVPDIPMPAGQAYNYSVGVTVQVNGVTLPSQPGIPPALTLPVAQK